MSTIESASQVEAPRKSYGWRLKILLGLNFLALGVFIFSRLSPSQVERLGPLAESLHAALNPSEKAWKFGPAGRRLMADVRKLGGQATRTGRTPGFLGLFGTEHFYVDVYGEEFGDGDLARLIEKHGDRITGLDLRQTKVTDAGLRHLQGMPLLEDLVLGNADMSRVPRRQDRMPTSPITDAGLAHLRDLKKLRNLTLEGLPITDAGLAAMDDLPGLSGFNLVRTQVKGPGLARFKSLSRLVGLSLEGSRVNDEGLAHLAGATKLQWLRLNGLPLTADGLEVLKSMPGLVHLDITGCGFLDEEVAKFEARQPGLTVEHR